MEISLIFLNFVMNKKKIKKYKLKRSVDLLFVIIITSILLPIILIIYLFVKFTSKGPVIYWSDRIGRKNKIFKMPKFRSMITDTPIVATDKLLNPNAYLTSIGSFLRKSSLDEIPQVWCILKGEMSFVGPRPALFNQHDLIDLRKKEGIDSLLPGLTGLAQLNGRDDLPIKIKVKFDSEYMLRKSLWLDLKIIWLTIKKVIKRDGVLH